MKGVTFITDETHNKRFIQIDLSQLEKQEEAIHEFIDVLIAESRKDEESTSLEKAISELKKEGKIDEDF